MLRDFTFAEYRELLEALIDKGFCCYEVCGLHECRLRRFEKDEIRRVVTVRQDVDRLPENSRVIAHIQKELGIRSTFYFRAVHQSFNPEVIEEIAGMGHEIGYHYEDLSLAAKKRRTERRRNVENGRLIEKDGRQQEQLFEAAIESFGRNLEKLRKYSEVKTICMHGSPWSKLDSRLMWKHYDYKEFGVECEPYFDFNMESMLYLTDTGRRWNGSAVSIRDKAQSTGRGAQFFENDSRLRDPAFNRRASSDREEAERLSKKNKGQKERNKNEGMAKSARMKAEGRSDIENEIPKKNKRTTSSEKRVASSGQESNKQDLVPFYDWKVKPVPGSLINMTAKSIEFQSRYNFRTSSDIIGAMEQSELPDSMMVTFHPHRWNEPGMLWWRELVGQNIKNVIKYFIIKIR